MDDISYINGFSAKNLVWDNGNFGPNLGSKVTHTHKSGYVLIISFFQYYKRKGLRVRYKLCY